jgi:hypothetical protein
MADIYKTTLTRRALITKGMMQIAAAAALVRVGSTAAAGGSRKGSAKMLDQSCKLLSDTLIRSIPDVPKPGYLQSYVDPTFGTLITRISGDPGSTIPNIGGKWSNIVKHHYSKDQAWNADQSLLYLATNNDGIIHTKGGIFIDGQSYQPVLAGAAKPSGGEVRWHLSKPDLMNYVAGSTLGLWNVRTGAQTTIKTFLGYNRLSFGAGEGNFSIDGRRVVLDGIRSSDGNVICFAYDLSSDTKYPDIDVSALYAGALGNVSISSLGNFIVMVHSSDHTTVFDLNGNIVTEFDQYGRPSHFDYAVDTDGDEVVVGVSKYSGEPSGRIIKRRLRDGAITVLTSGGYASHTSTRDTLASPPWALVSYEAHENPPLYFGEITAVHLTGDKVFRLCHHHNVKVDYDSEVHGAASPEGTRVVFVSNWGDATAGRPVQTYVVDLRQPCAI